MIFDTVTMNIVFSCWCAVQYIEQLGKDYAEQGSYAIPEIECMAIAIYHNYEDDEDLDEYWSNKYPEDPLYDLDGSFFYRQEEEAT